MIGLSKLLTWIGGKSPKHPDAQLDAVRVNNNRTAIVFLHGFNGATGDTWSSFTTQLLSDSDLADWDILHLGFPSRFSLDLPIWTADPGLVVCARGMTTKLNSSALKKYECIALVAHSMGGLVAQRAILDSACFDRRLSHLIMFGTPSAGLKKAGLGQLLKQQLKDMSHDSEFIRSLRADWAKQIGENPSFAFRTVAGDLDAFVPPESSIFPFAERYQEVIPGNHLEIIGPSSREDLSYDVLKSLLKGDVAQHSTMELARLALEHKNFLSVIERFLPNAANLDENAIVALALALESEGRPVDAMQVIENWSRDKPNLDPKGVLAGRLKRRWLVERKQEDFERALALYRQGYADAISGSDHAQVCYHAINVAFLLLAQSRVNDPVPKGSIDAAKIALKHVALAPLSEWSAATEGEAKLICGELEEAIVAYGTAYRQATTVRARNSMYVQATVVAARVFGEDARRRIDAAFGVDRHTEIQI